MTDYDRRQMNQMLGLMDRYGERKISLDALANDLEGLLNAIEFDDVSWKRKFLHHWGALEEIRAVARFRAITEFDDDIKKVLHESIEKLRQLVHEKLSD